MYKQWQEELKKKAPKMEDISEVTNYLESNHQKFYDDMMVQLHYQQEKDICLEMGTILTRYNIIVNEEKLLKWAKMCMALENIDTDICQDIALRAKLQKLERTNTNLCHEIEMLKYENGKLKEILEYEKED